MTIWEVPRPALRQAQGPAGELFRLLFDSAEIAKFTAQEKIKYEYDMTTERDIRNQIAYAYDKGREDERTKIEEQLRKKGLSNEDIASLFDESKAKNT